MGKKNLFSFISLYGQQVAVNDWKKRRKKLNF